MIMHMYTHMYAHHTHVCAYLYAFFYGCRGFLVVINWIAACPRNHFLSARKRFQGDYRCFFKIIGFRWFLSRTTRNLEFALKPQHVQEDVIHLVMFLFFSDFKMYVDILHTIYYIPILYVDTEKYRFGRLFRLDLG